MPAPSPDDAHLLLRLQQADATAMDLMIERYQRELLGLAHALLHDAEAARDAVQEAFMRLCRDRATLTPGPLGGWLATVVRNHCLDRLRQRPVQHLPESLTAPNPTPELNGDPLWAAVAGLSPLERAAVILRYRDECSYAHIAEALGKTVTHVGVILNQAMSRLRADHRLHEEYAHV